MATLMEDPVMLPMSKQIVDRDTIVTHLLSDPNDPFNRAPLKIEDVIPGRLLSMWKRRADADFVYCRYGIACSHSSVQGREERTEDCRI